MTRGLTMSECTERFFRTGESPPAHDLPGSRHVRLFQQDTTFSLERDPLSNLSEKRARHRKRRMTYLLVEYHAAKAGCLEPTLETRTDAVDQARNPSRNQELFLSLGRRISQTPLPPRWRRLRESTNASVNPAADKY